MNINDSQRSAAEFNKNKHLLVLAGAGTGKTRTIIARTEYLINSGTDPSRVLLITFTNKAANEIKERLKLKFNYLANDIFIGTFHFFCLSVMRKMPKAFGIDTFKILDKEDQKDLFNIIRGTVVSKKKRFYSTSDIVEIYSYVRNTCQSLEEYFIKNISNDIKELKTVSKIINLYERRKLKQGYIDFDDILTIFVSKLHSENRIKDQLKGLFDQILVDEMQDTNPLQFRILEGLINPALLFCVGDDAQSIYSFRGADFRNIHSFCTRIDNSTTLQLEDNYRSTQEILDLANWLLECSPLQYNKQLKAIRGSGTRPTIIDFNDDFAQARWISQDILIRNEAGTSWRDHMILVRSAQDARALEGIFIEKKIPWMFFGGTSLINAAHVKDLFSLLRIGLDHFDELAWFRFLTLWPRVGPLTAEKITSEILKLPSKDQVKNLLSCRFGISHGITNGYEIASTITETPDKLIKGVGDFLNDILSQKYDHWEQRQQDFSLLSVLGADFKTIKDFLDIYTIEPVFNTRSRCGNDNDAVTVITIHSAKGAEAPVCYLLKAQPGIYPHFRSIGNEEKEEEERRCLYVAITRAKNELIITRSQHGADLTSLRAPKIPSHPQNGYFFSYFPMGLVIGKSFVTRRPNKMKSLASLRDFKI